MLLVILGIVCLVVIGVVVEIIRVTQGPFGADPHTDSSGVAPLPSGNLLTFNPDASDDSTYFLHYDYNATTYPWVTFVNATTSFGVDVVGGATFYNLFVDPIADAPIEMETDFLPIGIAFQNDFHFGSLQFNGPSGSMPNTLTLTFFYYDASFNLVHQTSGSKTDTFLGFPGIIINTSEVIQYIANATQIKVHMKLEAGGPDGILGNRLTTEGLTINANLRGFALRAIGDFTDSDFVTYGEVSPFRTQVVPTIFFAGGFDSEAPQSAVNLDSTVRITTIDTERIVVSSQAQGEQTRPVPILQSDAFITGAIFPSDEVLSYATEPFSVTGGRRYRGGMLASTFIDVAFDPQYLLGIIFYDAAWNPTCDPVQGDLPGWDYDGGQEDNVWRAISVDAVAPGDAVYAVLAVEASNPGGFDNASAAFDNLYVVEV